MARHEESNQTHLQRARSGKATLVAIAMVLWCRSDLVAGAATGRTTARASCIVSVTIPQVTGVDMSMGAIAGAAGGGEHLTVRLFQTGADAILIRTTPRERDTNAIRTVSLKHDAPSVQMIGAITGGGWQEFSDSLPDGRVQHTSSKPQRIEVTYEVWKF